MNPLDAFRWIKRAALILTGAGATVGVQHLPPIEQTHQHDDVRLIKQYLRENTIATCGPLQEDLPDGS